MSEDNLEIVQRAVDAVNRRDKEGWLALNAADVEFRADPDWPESRWLRGRETVWDFLIEILGVWEPADFEPVEVLPADQDKVVAHYRASLRAKASGIVSEFDYWYVATIRDGLTARHEWFSNRGAALQAAGLPD